MLTPYRGPDVPQEYQPSGLAATNQDEVSEAPEGVNWARILAALRRYKWLALAIVVFGSVAGVLSTRFLTPQYQVGATIYITDQAGANGPIRGGALLQESGWIELFRSFGGRSCGAAHATLRHHEE